MGKISKSKGITLIALIITVILMLILAGIAVSALTSDNGLFDKTRYAAELSKFTSIKEAIEIYNVTGILEDNVLPVKRNVSLEELNNNPKLKNEIGYYRVYMMMGEKPILPQDFSGDFVATPSGIADLYYLDAEKLGINVTEDYFYDTVTEEVYSVSGVKLKGEMGYSEAGIKEIMLNNFVPSFITLGTVIVPEPPTQDTDERKYRFADSVNTPLNLYKIYNNGDVYGIGQKGYMLNNTEEEMKELDTNKWVELDFNSVIHGGLNKLILGSQAHRRSQMFITTSRETYVSGENGRGVLNKFGLSTDVLSSYNAENLNKLEFSYGVVKRAFTGDDTTFIITEDNKLYACGSNTNGQLGIGNYNNTSTYYEVQGISDVDKIKYIHTYADIYFTIIEMTDNTFYFSGINYAYAIGDGRASSYKVNKFEQIWNNGEYDIDQDIKKIGVMLRGIAVLKNDGTFMMTSSTSGVELTDFIDTDKTKFRRLREEVGSNITDILIPYNGIIIEKTLNGEKTYYGYAIEETANIGIGIKDYTVDARKLYEIELPDELKNEGIKEVNVLFRLGLMFISNAGNIYYCGDSNASGIDGKTGTILTITKLPINNIANFYKSNEGYGLTYVYLQGKDGKVYTIANPLALIGKNSREYTFRKIASNMKDVSIGNVIFSINTLNSSMAYISNDNNLYVSGNDRSKLGIGVTDNNRQLQYVKVEDPNIMGKAEKVSIRTYGIQGIYVVTVDKKLYKLDYLTNSYKEILTDIEGLYSVWNNLIIYNQNSLWYNTNSTDILTQIELSTIDASLVNNIQDVKCNGGGLYILTKDGQVWSRGSIPTSGTLNNHSNFQRIPQTSFDNKKVIKVVCAGEQFNDSIVLTEDGRVYGWGGDRSLFGLGETVTVAQNTPILLPIDNVEDIIATSSGFIVKKNNGEVWATGKNETGIFGRWVSSDRKYAKTVNQTAYEWVRCPSLEK